MPNKKAFISGVTKGIGKAVANRLQKDGFEIWGCASTGESIEAFSAENPKARLFQCDLSKKPEVKEMTGRLNDEAGCFDALVNNAGIFIPGKIHEEDDETFEKLMALNMNGTYYLTKALLPPMLEARSGDVVNICSTASITPYPNGGSYCISKFAQLGFSRVLREEMKAYDIRVFSVMPGPTYTASWEGADVPKERFAQPEDVAETVASALRLPKGAVVEELIIRPLQGDLG